MSAIKPATWYCTKCLEDSDMPCIFTADDEGSVPEVCPFGCDQLSEWKRG